MRVLITMISALLVCATTAASAQQHKCPGHDVGPVAGLGESVDAAAGEIRTLDDAIARVRSVVSDWAAERVRSPQARDRGLRALVAVDESGFLGPALRKLAGEVEVADMPEEKRVALAERLAGMIHVELCTAGLLEDCAPQEAWEDYGKRVIAKLDASGATAHKDSRLTSPKFLSELADIANTRFTTGNCVTVLSDGPDAFARRARMLEKAHDSYHIMSWSIYDDETGADLRTRVLAAREAGLEDIRIIVDGNTAEQPHHRDIVQQLLDDGVQIIKYRDPNRPGDGIHVKLEVRDGREMIVDSRNYGDVYSHRGPEGTPRWGDMGAQISGPAALDADRFFAQVWNEQVDAQGLDYDKIHIDDKASVEECGSARVAAVGHRPGRDENIILAKMKMLRGTAPGERFDIQNAYLIGFPPLESELTDAARRGVDLHVYTNSATSIDEPIVIAPGLGTVHRLLSGGVKKVLLQNGTDTLHAKSDTAGSNLTLVGSDNYHPRRRYETEFVVIIDDAATNAAVRADFDADARDATLVTDPSAVEVPSNTFSDLAQLLFYNQL